MSYWFDPMVQTAGMPGYSGAVDQGQAYNAAIAAQQAQQQAMLAQANAYNPFANTPGGFGGQTAYYAGLGAAYGRAVPQSSPAAVAAYQGGAAGGQADRLRALYPGAFSGGGIGSDAIAAPDAAVTRQPTVPQPENWEGTFNNTVNGNPDNPTVLGDSSWYPSERTPAPAADPYAFLRGAPSSGQVGPHSSAFSYNPASMAGGGGGQVDRLRALYPGAFSGDIGSSPMARPMPNLGYNPGMANSFANPGMNANPFQNRFGMGFPNAGTPSQYAPGAQMPGSFSPLYGVDQPRGALPLGGGPQSNLNWYGQPNASS